MLADSAETPITTDANSDQAGPPHGELVAVGAARRPSSGQIAGPPDSPSHLVPPDVLSRLTTLFTEIRNLGDDALLGDRCSGSSIDVRTLAAATALLPYLAWQRRNSPDVKGPDLVRLAVRNAVDLLSHFSKVQPSGRE